MRPKCLDTCPSTSLGAQRWPYTHICYFLTHLNLNPDHNPRPRFPASEPLLCNIEHLPSSKLSQHGITTLLHIIYPTSKVLTAIPLTLCSASSIYEDDILSTHHTAHTRTGSPQTQYYYFFLFICHQSTHNNDNTHIRNSTKQTGQQGSIRTALILASMVQNRRLKWQHQMLTLSIANDEPTSRTDSSIEERSAVLIDSLVCCITTD